MEVSLIKIGEGLERFLQAPSTLRTDVKVKQAVATVFAYFSAVLGTAALILTFTASLWFLAASIPFFLASGAIIWYASKLIDYDDSITIQRLQKEAQKMSFPDIVKKHGWENIFKVLTPKQFEQSYIHFASRLSLKEIIKHHKDALAKGIKTGYRLPTPDLLKEKLCFDRLTYWDDSCLEDLIQYSLIDPETFQQSFIAFAENAPLRQIYWAFERAQSKLEKIGKTLGQEKVQPFTLPEPSLWKEKLKTETYGYSFKMILNNYSLQSLIRYSLIDPETFQQSFIAFAEKALFRDLIYMFHRADEIEKPQAFTLPSLSAWKHKYLEETASLSCKEIAAQYSISFLHEQKVIGSREYELLQKLETAEEELQAQIANSKKNFKREIARLEKVRDEAVELAESLYKAQGFEEKEEDLRGKVYGPYLSWESTERSRLQLSSLEQRKAKARYAKNQTISAAEKELSTQVEAMRKQTEAEIALSHKQYQKNLVQINSEYAAARAQSPQPSVEEISA